MPSASLSVPALSGAGARARAQNTMVGDMVWLFCVLLVLTLLGRAAFVFPLSLAHNWYAREQLSFKEMVVIWRAPAPPCLMTSRRPCPVQLWLERIGGNCHRARCGRPASAPSSLASVTGRTSGSSPRAPRRPALPYNRLHPYRI